MAKKVKKSQRIEFVETEVGRATVGVVKPHNAYRPFKCPLCDQLIAIGDSHYAVIPMEIPRLRRHIHTDCLEIHVAEGYIIKLHPNEPDVVSFYT